MISFSLNTALEFWLRRMQKLALLILDPDLRSLYRKGAEPISVMALAAPWLTQMQFRTIIDLGANRGQFALAMAASQPKARFICVEPIPSCAADLRVALAGLDAEVHEVAVGGENATALFFEHKYSDSSSLMRMGRLHEEAFPFAADVHQKYHVQVRRLDDLLAGAELKRPALLKLDVQGGELAALEGGTGVLRQVDSLLVETSVMSLYVDVPLFHDVYAFVSEAGFEMKGVLSTLYDPRSHRPLQMDCFFERKDSAF